MKWGTAVMAQQTPLDKIKPPHEDQILLTRDQVRCVLGISYHQVVVLEMAGKLDVVRLMPTIKSTVMYSRDQVLDPEHEVRPEAAT